MTGSEYQKLAMRTCNIPPENKSDRFYHAVFGLNSEAGEVAESCKRNTRDIKLISST